jgi:hypothetical protein
MGYQSKIESKFHRAAYLFGIAAVFLPALEPFLPLIFTLAGSILLGNLVKFFLNYRINRTFNQPYKASGPSGQHASAGDNGGRQTPPLPPPPKEDPLKMHRELLGLPPHFTQAQLKAQYRAMAASYHPDRYSGVSQTEKQQAEEMMKKINAAYAILKK